jgi:hypothetical protein
VRYYDIQLAGGGATGGSFGSGWTSHPSGVADPGAQEVLMNLEVYNASNDPQNGMAASDQSTVEIQGVSWQQIKDSNKLIGTPIKIFGGIKPGPELATAQSRNAGQLVSGTIAKTWGSWVGTDMSLGISFIASSPSTNTGVGSQGQFGDTSSNSSTSAAPASQATTADAQNFRVNRTGIRSIDRRNFARGRQPVVNPLDGGGDFGLGTLVGGLSSGLSGAGGALSSLLGGGFPGLTKPLNIIHNMMENMPLSSAIQQTLSTAFPQLKMKINISPQLKLNYQDAGVYQNLEQYAGYILNLSRSIMGAKNYLGVHMSVDNGVMNIWDGTGFSASDNLSAIDLIGQPTWVDVNTVEIKVVMRGHLALNDKLIIPTGTLINFAGPAGIVSQSSQQRSNITFEGMYISITKITHIGDFRNPDGNYWCTVIRGLASNPPAVPTFNISNQIGSQSQFGVPPLPNNTEPLGNVEIGKPIIVDPSDPNEPSSNQQIMSFGSIFKRSVRRH